MTHICQQLPKKDLKKIGKQQKPTKNEFITFHHYFSWICLTFFVGLPTQLISIDRSSAAAPPWGRLVAWTMPHWFRTPLGLLSSKNIRILPCIYIYMYIHIYIIIYIYNYIYIIIYTYIHTDGVEDILLPLRLMLRLATSQVISWY